MNECLAVNSTISFWRELLQKEFSSSFLHKKGMEISRNYQKIQDIASSIQRIYPDDIKFFFRYGRFLITIINNEYEGIMSFKRAIAAFEVK